MRVVARVVDVERVVRVALMLESWSRRLFGVGSVSL